MAFEEPPPRASVPMSLIIGISVFGLLVTIGFAVMIIRGVGRHRPVTVSTVSGSIRLSPGPGALPGRADPASSVAQSLETALDASNADQVVASANETTFIKTFDFEADVTFELKNVNGSVTIEAWDKPQAQITVIKRGSEGDRKAAQVYFKKEGDGLSLRTAYSRGSNNKGNVVFQIKLPRTIESLDLNTVNGGIKVSDITGEITAQTVNGLVDLANVSGVKKAQSVNGNIKAVLKDGGSEPMEFKNTNGNIDLQIKGDLDAELEAAAVRGVITIDDLFGVTVQKQVVGQKASGRIGAGGEPLKITTVNGSIKLSK